MVISQACRYTSAQLCAMRGSRPLQVTARDVIRQLGCARRARGCRGGAGGRVHSAPAVNNNSHRHNNNNASLSADICPTPVTCSQAYIRPTTSCSHLATSKVTVLGLLNARSVASKSSSLYDLIKTEKLHLFAVTETWHDSVNSPQLIACAPPGYRYIEKARPRADSELPTTRTNYGGICLFYASFLGAREVALPCYKSGIEVLAVLLRGARRNAVIVTVYRPGSDVLRDDFFDDLADILERMSTYSCPFILLGDVNIHLDVADDHGVDRWKSILDSYGLVQHVTSPTHSAGHILDVIVTRFECAVTAVDVQPPTLSDHSFIKAHVDLCFSHEQAAAEVRRRRWRQFDFDRFADDLSHSPLLLSPPDDVTSLVACYNSMMRDLLDKHVPLCTVKLRAHKNAPWYDLECRQVKVATRKLERVYRRDKTCASRKAWREQSSVLRSTLRRKYVEYWRRTIEANSGDTKALWSKVSALLKMPESASTTAHTADDFAEYFRSKVNTIRQTTADAQPAVFTDRTCTRLSAFDDVTVEELTSIVNNSPSKHCELDPAPTWLVKRALPLLIPIFVKVCNLSFRQGVFPDVLKSAVVRPRLKKPTLDPDDVSSYRPISNLSFLSKLVERVVAARLTAHIETQQLLPQRQSAYRARHSTETAVVAVHDQVVKAVDSGSVCALVLLDLSAAFDTVDHPTLLRVLNRRFGVDGTALTWCQSYLNNRTQTFCLNGQSGQHSVDCSVPQGSVLGPRMFSCYTEDLAELITCHQLGYHLYADDTQLIATTSVNGVESNIDRIQQCLSAIQSWCASRRLQLNPSKTELIWFGSRVTLGKITTDLSVSFGCDVVQPSHVVRDLGVMLDSELSLRKHVSSVARACFFQIRRLKQVRRLLGPDITATLVSAFVLSRLDYCNSVLVGLPKLTIAPLQRVQNAAARLVANLGTRDHVSSTLRDLHWLPVNYRITYKLCYLMHLVHTGHAPAYLANSVTATASIESRLRLRSASTLRYEVPRTRLKFGERSFTFAGPLAWNSLPSDVQCQDDTQTFKRKLKAHLFERAFPSAN